MRAAELELEGAGRQGSLFGGLPAQQIKLSLHEAKASVLAKLETFLAKHSKAQDLGLRLDGQQLAAGVQFVRMSREKTYDIVVGNPPYQGLSKTESFGYVTGNYPSGKDNLYAAFMERGLQLVKYGGILAQLTMRGWMFIAQFAALRKLILKADLRTIGDLDRGAFEDVPDEVLATVMSVIRQSPGLMPATALQPTPLSDRARDGQRAARKRAALLTHVGRYEFDPHQFSSIRGQPLVYWWPSSLILEVAAAPPLGDVATVTAGAQASPQERFLRRAWELHPKDTALIPWCEPYAPALRESKFVPYVAGGKGREWCEPVVEVLEWQRNGLQLKISQEFRTGSVSKRVAGQEQYFRPCLATTAMGSDFGARSVRYRSVIGHMGSFVFSRSAEDSSTAAELSEYLAILNSSRGRFILQSLNPGTGFEVGDTKRLPVVGVASAVEIATSVDRLFTEHESHRETSVEFHSPGPTAWSYAQRWAQSAVDRPASDQLPLLNPNYDNPPPVAYVSFAVGLCLGRFVGGKGVARGPRGAASVAGVLFLSSEAADGLDDAASKPIVEAWRVHGAAIGSGDDLRTYLRKSFFDYHRKLYENRPIYLPLSSARKSFVAFVSIHLWQDDTLNVLLADHLVPAKRRLQGELEDLHAARVSPSSRGKAEKRFADLQNLLEELNDFIEKVTQVAEKGPTPLDDRTAKREVDARYVMDLDDGVMVNSAALWPLVEPQWKDPKKWWGELATAQGKRDYDWSHQAARYFPVRVRKKCLADPSIALAHGCFWELHPAKAYAWELRLQDEIRPDFTIDEPGSDTARRQFLAEHATKADELKVAEARRRARRAARAGAEPGPGSLFESEDEELPADEEIED